MEFDLFGVESDDEHNCIGLLEIAKILAMGNDLSLLTILFDKVLSVETQIAYLVGFRARVALGFFCAIFLCFTVQHINITWEISGSTKLVNNIHPPLIRTNEANTIVCSL